MSLYTILETIFIGPLKLVFEVIFSLAHIFCENPGISIIALSLAMNLLVLPLYRRADAMQEAARDTDARLRDGIAHIKKTFTGDERMMMLQTYYRQNNYSPLSALSGSVSLLLEIPFFMAAYQFLSNLDVMRGTAFGPITDLGAPDGLLVIGGLTLNLLPILMTLINVISSALYLKGYPLKTKIQLYAMAGFFLVFLYASPSGLVFYWTLNNLFSLVKTIFYKLKNPKKVLTVLCSVLGAALLAAVAGGFGAGTLKRTLILVAAALALQLPLVWPWLKKLLPKTGSVQPNKKLFTWGTVFLTVLVGLLIPSTYLAASPQEYVDIMYFHHPVWYMVSSAALAAGTFLVWLRVFYWLANDDGKVFFERLVWVLCGVMLVNYMFFGTDMGIVSNTLQYVDGMKMTRGSQLLNLAVLVVLAAAMWFIAVKWSKAAVSVLLTACVALAGMTALNTVTVCRSVAQLTGSAYTAQSETPGFRLSKTGKNVVVMVLDRALGEYVPAIFSEKPQLQQQFAGFTFYDNTISFGNNTNFGIPAVYGGYEYTPVEMNRRKEEPLRVKHNESLLVMPVAFMQNGYEVTVFDPSYTNYQWTPDLSIYDAYPDIRAFMTTGMFGDPAVKEAEIQTNRRNFFCFSVMKTMPLIAQTSIYNNGAYHQQETVGTQGYYIQTTDGDFKASGIHLRFMDSYDVMARLSEIAHVTEDAADTFLMMTNNLPHEPMLLQMPDYVPAMTVDNTSYDVANPTYPAADGRTLTISNINQRTTYHANMATMLQLGKWFDWLRANDLYDNTRIILVADHGDSTGHFDDRLLDAAGGLYDTARYYPLLMVKDFNADTFTTSHEFMTNADVPTLAMTGAVQSVANPFTGKPINSDAKTAHEQYIILSEHWNVSENNGNQFLPAEWVSVSDNIWDMGNWTLYRGEQILEEHTPPQQ